MELSFLFGWAVTATIAAVFYAMKLSSSEKKHLWSVKMMLKLAANEAKVTRQGDTITFHYENEFESNTIHIQAK